MKTCKAVDKRGRRQTNKRTGANLHRDFRKLTSMVDTLYGVAATANLGCRERSNKLSAADPLRCGDCVDTRIGLGLIAQRLAQCTDRAETLSMHGSDFHGRRTARQPVARPGSGHCAGAASVDPGSDGGDQLELPHSLGGGTLRTAESQRLLGADSDRRLHLRHRGGSAATGRSRRRTRSRRPWRG